SQRLRKSMIQRRLGRSRAPDEGGLTGAGANDVINARSDEADTELELVDISKEFHARSGSVVALKDVSLSIRRREFVALVGRSGCGKTTMLRILAGLTHPTRGQVMAGGRPLWRDNDRDPETVDKLGLVFQ